LNDAAWYVLRTKPRKERVVARYLSAVSLELYYPRIIERVRAGLSVQRRVAPMFPSYLFVRADLREWGVRLHYTPGVRDFLRSEQEPVEIVPEIIAGLRERTGPSDVYMPPPRRFSAGERLAIGEGPLRGLGVIFERELSGSERVAVLLSEVAFRARVVLPSYALARG
jgi:transcriptional antiterminator RfaH